MDISQGRPARSGGRILVEQLLLHGTSMAFCVPGESYLEVLDSLFDVSDRLTLINARHEAGAANMAEAYGKLTGRPGICFVTRGPGACQAAVGVHTAYQDSTPMILLVGQVSRQTMDRESFQEIDYRLMFGPVAKWVAQVDVTARIPEYLARAFHIATSGRPGPVVLALPEDMLTQIEKVDDAQPYRAVQAAATPDQMAEFQHLLAASERPLLLVGGSGWTDVASRQIVAFAETIGIPAATSFRRQDLFDSQSPSFVGDLGTSGPPALVRLTKEADLLIVVGARLGDMTTQGYTLLDSPRPRQRLVHVHASADDIHRVLIPDLAIKKTQATFAAALQTVSQRPRAGAATWREALRDQYLADVLPPESEAALDLCWAMAALSDRLPNDAIVTLDAGNHTGWAQRFMSYGRPGRQIGSTCGAMGYSVPAAVAASLVHPERVVIGCVGDGGFMMSGTEIATAVQFGARPIILVFNNAMYGTIRMHQEIAHPRRSIGTDIRNPDFVALARSMGAHGEVVGCNEEFLPAFERALASGKVAMIELLMDPEQISTRASISDLRAMRSTPRGHTVFT